MMGLCLGNNNVTLDYVHQRSFHTTAAASNTYNCSSKHIMITNQILGMLTTTSFYTKSIARD